jgi:branched-chain amino acid transport system ATP-binding protein
LSVRENVEVAALGSGAAAREARRRATELLELLGLLAAAEAPAASLAHGDERRLGVARALATEPRYVLMDEPAAGLPEAEVPDFAAVVRSVRDDHGAGVLLIDHNMALIMEVCDRIQVLDQGRVLAEGTPAEIRGNLDVAAAYLGESAVQAEAE